MTEGKMEISLERQQLVRYLEERSKNISKYSDKLRKAVQQVSDYLALIRKQSGIIYVSSHVVSRDNWGEPLYLTIFDGWHVGLALCYIAPNGDYLPDKQYVSDFSRDELIETVKVLPQFLREYAEELKESEKEIKEFSEKAERIANILSEHR